MAEKVSFASCDAEFHRLMGDIKARKFAPIYLLQGEELYFIDALCDALTEGIMEESMRAFNQIVIYGNDTDGGTVASYCRQLPMMGEYEAIIVREAQQLDKIEQLHAYTASPQASTILVLCHNQGIGNFQILYFRALLSRIAEQARGGRFGRAKINHSCQTSKQIGIFSFFSIFCFNILNLISKFAFVRKKGHAYACRTIVCGAHSCGKFGGYDLPCYSCAQGGRSYLGGGYSHKRYPAQAL